MAKVGGWEFDLETQKLLWTEEVYRIHEADPDFIPNVDNGINFYSDESKPIIINAINRIIHNCESYDLELELITAKNNHRWVHTIGWPNFTNGKITSISGTFQDITEKMIERQNPDERQIEEQIIILNRAVENSPASIVITDSNGSIEYVNPRFTLITGYTFDEAVGKNPRILKSGNTPVSVYKELWDTILAGKDWHGELENRKKNGEIYLEKASISGIKDDHGIVTHFVAVKEDITVRKQFEEEIKSKNEQLQLTNAQKDKFFSIIAHDLRGPFSGFLGLTEILAEEIQSMPLDKIQDLAREMKRSAGNLYNLLSNLLEWSRTQRGLIDFKPEVIDMFEMAAHSFETFYETGRQKQVSFITKVPETTIAKADRYMIQTVLRNLISNALKFTPSGGTVSLIIQPYNSGEILCAVKDTGIGIPQRILENLFRIDVNVSRPETNNKLSTGLGLMLCKEFVEKHGGRIWAESEEGHGSTFYFTLGGMANNNI